VAGNSFEDGMKPARNRMVGRLARKDKIYDFSHSICSDDAHCVRLDVGMVFLAGLSCIEPLFESPQPQTTNLKFYARAANDWLQAAFEITKPFLRADVRRYSWPQSSRPKSSVNAARITWQPGFRNTGKRLRQDNYNQPPR
jgi:hypothetical protein